MVLSRVNLPDGATYSWTVISNNDKEVFWDKAQFTIRLHDFYMGEALTVGAHFVLAFDDEDSSIPKHSMRLYARIRIQFQYCFMVLTCCVIARSVVPVIRLESALALMGSAAGRMHIGRVENHAVDLTVLIRQVATIDSRLDVSSKNAVLAFRNVAPKNSFTVRYVRNYA